MIYWLLIFQVVLTWLWSLPSLNDNICLPAGKMENINKRYILKKAKTSADEQREAAEARKAGCWKHALPLPLSGKQRCCSFQDGFHNHYSYS